MLCLFFLQSHSPQPSTMPESFSRDLEYIKKQLKELEVNELFLPLQKPYVDVKSSRIKFDLSNIGTLEIFIFLESLNTFRKCT